MRTSCFLLFFFLISCGSEPEFPIPEDKMAHILKDMLIAEAAMNRVGRSVEDSLHQVYYNQIYRIHAVDSAQLGECFKIMQKNPELSELLYDKAEQLLVALEPKKK